MYLMKRKKIIKLKANCCSSIYTLVYLPVIFFLFFTFPMHNKYTLDIIMQIDFYDFFLSNQVIKFDMGKYANDKMKIRYFIKKNVAPLKCWHDLITVISTHTPWDIVKQVLRKTMSFLSYTRKYLCIQISVPEVQKII